MMGRRFGFVALLFGVLLALSPPASAQQEQPLDTFESIDAWRADSSDGVAAAISSVPGRTGRAMRLDFDFNTVSGYAFATRTLPIDFPENFEISFWMRADAPVNTLEIKFTDAAADNVWWRNRPNFTFPTEWTRVVIRRRHVSFAWGPTQDRSLRRTERIEFVVTRGTGGGRGSVYIDDLQIRELPADEGPLEPVSATASRSSPHSRPAYAFDRNEATRALTGWQAPAGRQHITFDLGSSREFGGLELRWELGGAARDYRVSLSDDGRIWRMVRRVADNDLWPDLLHLPESQARFIRLDLEAAGSSRYALNDIRIMPPEWAPTLNAYMEEIATRVERGVLPRGFSEQSYWTLIGADGAADSALVSEDGAVEIGKGGFSIEPFVRVGEEWFSWADVEIEQSLQEGDLPVPTVTWRAPTWRLSTTAFVDGDAAQSNIVTRYALTNTGAAPADFELNLAASPFQVNGPRQFLNTTGGVSPITEVGLQSRVLHVNERPRVWLRDAPNGFRGGRFDSGPLQRLPLSTRAIEDETGLATGAAVYRVRLAPNETREFAWCAPLTGVRTGCEGNVAARQETVAQAWRQRLRVVEIDVPESGQPIVQTLRTSLAHILMSREGPVLKPGTRSYDRSWIRDGAMIAEGLIQLGAVEEARDYLEWYAPYQFENGKIPCCVDDRGADPTPENDSHGEFIYLVAEVWRATRDEALLREQWPRVVATVRYMDELRQSEMAPNTAPERRHLYGLMPPSISHEGYSAHPAYSYWDDFWALLGYKEAVELARAVGDQEALAWMTRSRDAFRRDFYASINAVRRVHGIDFIPGAADLGDFDATSTTIGLTPGGEQARLPRAQLEATFERYWREFVARREGQRQWNDYTPYEIRNVGALVRLGWRERALEALDYFMHDRRPAPWNGWAEVVGREAREHRFIGDMPHAWISSDYIRSALELFVYRRDHDDALVLAAGLPPAWIAEGVSVRGLRTAYGTVGFSLRRERDVVTLTVEGDVPPGGFVLPWPIPERPASARFNDRRISLRDGAYVLNAPGRLEVTLRR